jgi:GMP synthase (glutamine-hydrolysing)
MQLLVERFGGRVAPGHVREYGRTALLLEPGEPSALLADFPPQSVVWMSHSDAAERVPDELRVLARTEHGAVAAVEARDLPITAVQFHPEVTHTDYGEALLRRFAFDRCGAQGDWSPQDMITRARWPRSAPRSAARA